MKVALVELGPSRPELHEPLGIETLAGYIDKGLAAYQVSTTLVSYSFTENAQSKIANGKFDVVGIGAKIGTWQRLQQLIETISRNGTHKPLIIVGDLIGTYAYKEILSMYPHVICVKGEGELGFHGIIESKLTTKGSAKQFYDKLCNVPGLAYYRDSRIIETESATIQPLDAPLPRRDYLMPSVAIRSQVQIEGSRGCPWSKCSFCSIPDLNTSAWRPFSLESILIQFIEASDAGARSIYFTDSDFLGSSIKNSLRFSKMLIAAKERGIVAKDLNFYINLQVTGIIGGVGKSNDDCIGVLRHLKQAGLREVFVGIESGGKEQVRRYVKASTPHRSALALQTLSNMELQSDVGFIMFDPMMDLEDILANLEFLRTCGLWFHPSRFTKALRIQPNTGYLKTMFPDTKPNLNINNLSYPYTFRDARVNEVYKAYRQWEIQHYDYETLVQGASKGEVSTELDRLEVRNYLGTLRSLDLEYLEFCASAAKAGCLDSERIQDKVLGLGSQFGTLRSKRPCEVELHAERLGIRLDTDFTNNTKYKDHYRALNTYEDPVYD